MKAVLAQLRANAMRAAAQIDFQDVSWVCGLGAVCYGLHQVYPPAAWIVGGAVVFWLAAVRRG